MNEEPPDHNPDELPDPHAQPPEKLDKDHGEETPAEPPETVEQIVRRGRQMGF